MTGHWSDMPADGEGAAPSEPPPAPLAVLARQLSAVSPAWAAATVEPDDAPPLADDPLLGRDRQQGFEAIREGWLMHRGVSRLATAATPDLALLVGDWCYAAGLGTIADHGSLDDVAKLAELVADVATRCDEPVEDLEARWATTAEELQRG